MSATETASKTASDATGDAGKSLLGGRKPTDAVPTSDLASKPTLGGTPGGPADPAKKEPKESSLKIHIELDLEVEVHLTARIKGDITIGLL